MQRKFGENSIWVYELLRGIDRSEVKEKPATTKSMLASKNLAQPVEKTSQGHHWIRVLAAELALRLTEAREATPALWPKTIVLGIRQGACRPSLLMILTELTVPPVYLGYEAFRSKQAPFPFTRDITVDYIASAGDRLWRELVGTETTRRTPFKITNVSLSFSGIDSMESGQRGIEGFFKNGSSSSPQRPHDAAASTSPGKLKRKRAEDLADDEDDDDVGEEMLLSLDHQDAGNQDQLAVDTRNGPEHAETSNPAGVHPTESVSEPSSTSSPTGFMCERCKKRVSLPDELREVEDGELKKEALAALRQEHDDWHFAEDLSRQHVADHPRRAIRPTSQSNSSGSKPRSGSTNGKKRRKDKDSEGGKGIAKFFSKS
ncbi:DNA-directed DNA polymerase eta rad30 [Steccherinum ochraceum]|uniref:DNA-directed DNA polymerase eta rad30 n=1 Tax=Steccherinum ochraceum TaxID=92696 RepID=A0A4V2MWE2_9APHY|nr:DNA-directed DNA polymerase eta rad30 [Steccherinum ochraceum]